MGDNRFDTAVFLRQSLAIFVAIVLAAVLGAVIATNGRIELLCLRSASAAAACCLVVFIPAIAVGNWHFFGANRFLASLAWRFPTSLASILAAGGFVGVPRNCFVAALLTCYFVGLLLESWLQIRQCRRSDSRPGSHNLDGNSKTG